MKMGVVPALKFVGALKDPVPVPSRIETLFASVFATARSGRPSPLKSPMATALGFVPTVSLRAPSKLGAVHATCAVAGPGHALAAGQSATVRIKTNKRR